MVEPTKDRNWLRELDRKARGWLRANDILGSGYRAFWFARYPRLLPRPLPGDPHSKLACETDYKTFSNLLCDQEEQISRHQEASPTLTGLSAKQRMQLAALLLDTIVDLQDYGLNKGLASGAQTIATQAESRTRVLVRKVANARRALEKLREYAKSLNPLLGRDYELAAQSCLKKLTSLEKFAMSKDELGNMIKSEYPTPKDPVTFAMFELYCFFRFGCRLPGDQAEVRVARLRNSFWGKYGVRPVPYRAAYNKESAESAGCDAVHQAVSRYSMKVVS